jgi:hypothetical protein
LVSDFRGFPKRLDKDIDGARLRAIGKADYFVPLIGARVGGSKILVARDPNGR